MLQPVVSYWGWLKLIYQHSDNGRWLSEHENDLYAATKDALYRNPTFHEGVDLLMLVGPYYAFVVLHTQKWLPLFLEAYLQAQDLRDNEIQIQILTQLGEAYLASGKNEMARESFKIALKRAQEGAVKESELLTYIGLIRIQSVSMGDEYDPQLLSLALNLSHEIDDVSLKAQAEETVLLAYIHQRETAKAIEHGQIAYILWHHLDNRLEMAKTLYLLSVAYRTELMLGRAEALLQIAADFFENTEYNRQYIILAHDTAVLYLLQKEYEPAAQWATVALREASSIDVKAHIVSSHHVLGLAQTGLGQYDDAAKNLQQAMKGWEELNNYYEIASTRQAMGNLENKRKHPAEALKWLEVALEWCKKAAESRQRDWLEDHIRATIDEIEW
jgi:tetratricopeptide (TPR) repeat protein